MSQTMDIIVAEESYLPEVDPAGVKIDLATVFSDETIQIQPQFVLQYEEYSPSIRTNDAEVKYSQRT
jgi:hypothetical protein